jgi:hypothetical protein
MGAQSVAVLRLASTAQTAIPQDAATLYRPPISPRHPDNYQLYTILRGITRSTASAMQPSTRFKALRSDPEDDTYQNVNTDSRELPSDKLPYCANNERKFTFRERMSTFPWRPFLIVALLPLALAPIIALAASAETASRNYIFRRNCYPNGLWWNSPGATWKIMDSSYFFIPNLSFGTMTFTQVKVIDIAWDLTVGRGGQVLLAWVNYRVFNEWLVYHMECHLTSYKLYASVAFKTTSVSTLGVLGKEFLAYGKGTWKRFFRWLAILSMFLSTLYVLSFPTLMAAMTGYISIFEPYVEDYNNNLIKASKVDLVWCVINDAHRIGYEKPLLVGQDNKNLTTAVQSCMFPTTSRSSTTNASKRHKDSQRTNRHHNSRHSRHRRYLFPRQHDFYMDLQWTTGDSPLA